jgi:Interferon-induced transmembrane protein
MIGIFAILRSADCRAANAAGNREVALTKSRQARLLAHSALGVGLLILIILVILECIVISNVMQMLNSGMLNRGY